MKKNKSGWIKHSHLFDPDDYECLVCGKRFANLHTVCPSCGSTIQSVSKRNEPDWIDEAEELNCLLDDD